MDESLVNPEEAVDKGYGKKAKIVLDATMLTTLMNCPRLSDFRFNHCLQPIGGKSNSLECGSIVHKFLEVYYGNIIKGIKRDDALGFGMAAAEMYIKGCPGCTGFIVDSPCPTCNGLGYTKDNNLCLECKGKAICSKPRCGHEIDEYPGVMNTPPDSEGYRIGWKYVLQTCDEYHTFYRNDSWVPLLTEEVKGKLMYEDDELIILWKAKLDLAVDTNQGIYPVDHKTMKQRRDSLSLNNQFIGQCLVMGTRQAIINKIGFQTSLKPVDKFVRVMLSYSADRLIEWQQEILPYYSKLLLMYAENGYFPPNFSACEGKYGNCSFKDVCESSPNMRQDEIKRLFVVGPIWNPVNSRSDE